MGLSNCIGSHYEIQRFYPVPIVGTVPVASLALILGIDRFMCEARAITNLIGNAVATIVVAKWEKEIDPEISRKLIG